MIIGGEIFLGGNNFSNFAPGFAVCCRGFTCEAFCTGQIHSLSGYLDGVLNRAKKHPLFWLAKKELELKLSKCQWVYFKLGQVSL